MVNIKSSQVENPSSHKYAKRYLEVVAFNDLVL